MQHSLLPFKSWRIEYVRSPQPRDGKKPATECKQEVGESCPLWSPICKVYDEQQHNFQTASSTIVSYPLQAMPLLWAIIFLQCGQSHCNKSRCAGILRSRNSSPFHKMTPRVHSIVFSKWNMCDNKPSTSARVLHVQKITIITDADKSCGCLHSVLSASMPCWCLPLWYGICDHRHLDAHSAFSPYRNVQSTGHIK